MKFLVTRTLEFVVDAEDSEDAMDKAIHMSDEDADEDYTNVEEIKMEKG